MRFLDAASIDISVDILECWRVAVILRFVLYNSLFPTFPRRFDVPTPQ
ncbi:hypothetical protein CAter282_1038 [Collimonas arenae]|uniref:Uncharacterized protein n=1 Tax=Collimonas arenae TaxID=279058 RepID=A0A127PMD2_9BURK|nr:hypothetical protein CAter10_1124 [Collimonas arenae]AMP08833.1 hypothetical protein CAter282_1038 [Collimonas arenae]